MAASMKRRAKPRSHFRPANHYVEDRGRRYRVCVSGAHVLFVELRARKEGSRMHTVLEYGGRRSREIARLAGFEVKRG